MHTFLRFLLSSVVVLGWAGAGGAEDDTVEIRTLTGQSVKGTLESVNDKEIVVSGQGPIPIAQVLEVSFPEISAAGNEGKLIDVELVDGSMLHCSQVTLKGKNVVLNLVSGQEIKDLHLTAISYVLNDAQDAKVRQAWQGFLAKRGNRDLVAIKSKGGVVNTLDGTFGDEESESKIGFESSNGVKGRISLDRIHGMAFFRRPNPDTAPTLFRANDLSKDVLVVVKVTKGESGYTLTTVAGAKLEYPFKSFTRWDFSKGKLTFLSDLEPKLTELSNIERVEHYRRDKNLEGEPIQLLEKSGDSGIKLTKYSKGLCLHAYTELIYDIGGEYKEFKAVLGVDPRIGGESDVRVLIEGDGRELFSSEVRRRDEPRPITLDVKNVKQLRVVVSSAGLLDLGNHVCLADAKVSK